MTNRRALLYGHDDIPSPGTTGSLPHPGWPVVEDKLLLNKNYCPSNFFQHGQFGTTIWEPLHVCFLHPELCMHMLRVHASGLVTMRIEDLYFSLPKRC